jgi:hypothetical protein
MNEMFTKLGLKDYKTLLEAGWMNELLEKQEKFVILEKWEPLFKRFDLD